MDVSIKIKKIDLPGFWQDLNTIINQLDDILDDGISIMLYRSELRKVINTIHEKHTALNDKNAVKFIFKPAAAFVLYNVFTAFPDESFTDIALIRKILAAIDQVQISYKPVKNRKLFLEEPKQKFLSI